MKELDSITIEDASELRSWLMVHHAQRESVWLVRWTKGSGKPAIGYDEIVDELLCFGWVDSLPRKLDGRRTKLLISPRSPRSNWSAVNKARVERLIAAGRMHPAGMRSVDLARSTGTWNALDAVEALVIPADLQAALEAAPKAAHCFHRFPRSAKRGILEWIGNAKRPETRVRRIEETVEKASRNVKAAHPKGRDAGPQDSLPIPDRDP